MSTPPSTVSARLARWLYEQRWVLLVFIGALITRWHWNSVVHPLGDYIYSDMNGYVSRAHRLLHKGLEPHEYSSFFPYGTHWLIAGVLAVAGEENWIAVGHVYAVLGAVAVAAAYAFARRASRFPHVVAPIVGVIGIFYYPTLSLGGYLLSETPYTAFFCLSLVFLMRMIDHGKVRDALLMGTCVAIALTMRPQILLSAATIGLFWLWRRKSVPKLKLWHLLVGFLPVVLSLGLSAALLKHNTGRSGLVSENGSFNLVFGRCHNSKIQSRPDGKGHGRVHFRPPPFLQLNNLENKLKKERKYPPVRLNPAMGDVITYRGYIGDGEQHMKFVRECIEKTGWVGQLEYTYTNVILLWRYNIPWPDSGRKQWRDITRWWTALHWQVIAIPSLLGLVFLCFRRTAKMGFMAANTVAMLLVAGIYFGGTRHRETNDYVNILMAVEVYAWAAYGLYLGFLALRARRAAKARTSAAVQ